MRTPILSEQALTALRQSTVTSDSITLPPERLERWVWQQVNAAADLLGGGGRWDSDCRGWVFDQDPRPSLEAFLTFQDRADITAIRQAPGRVHVLAGASNPNVILPVEEGDDA